MRWAAVSHEHLGRWHLWFAWHPVTLIDGTRVWWEFVERRLEDGEAVYDDNGLITLFEYRKPGG